MLISTGRFLRLILPTEGYYCGVIFGLATDKPYQFFTPSLDSLEQQLLAADANGHTVYHACASFSAPGRRTQDAARFARALWLDLDVGDGPTKYATKTEACVCLDKFTRDAALPAPDCVVESGHGLHVYWCFAENVRASDWREASANFRDLCDQHGFMADHSRTCDLATILRPVGSTNRKTAEYVPVRGHVPCQ